MFDHRKRSTPLSHFSTASLLIRSVGHHHKRAFAGESPVSGGSLESGESAKLSPDLEESLKLSPKTGESVRGEFV